MGHINKVVVAGAGISGLACEYRLHEFVRLISRGTPQGSGNVRSPLFWNLPSQDRAMTRVFWVQEKFCVTASRLENLSAAAVRVAERGNFTDKPVIILSASSIPAKRLEAHIAMAKRLPRGRHAGRKEQSLDYAGPDRASP